MLTLLRQLGHFDANASESIVLYAHTSFLFPPLQKNHDFRRMIFMQPKATGKSMREPARLKPLRGVGKPCKP
jgi:hypothetical protein